MKNPGGALQMSHLWNTKGSGILSSSILMFVNSTLGQIVKSRNSNYYFPILPSSLLPSSLLPNCEVYIASSSFFLFANFHFCQIARSELPNFQVSIVKCAFSSCRLHITILLFCQIIKSTSPFGLPKWASSCPSLLS